LVFMKLILLNNTMKTKEQEHAEIVKNNYEPTIEFYSQIFDSLQDYAIFTVDENFVINSWNPASKKIFGYEPEEAIGKHFDIIFTDEDKKSGVPQREIKKALKDGRATDNRWHICKDRSIFYAYGLVFPLTDKDGIKIGYVKVLRDLTDKKKSDDLLKAKMNELEELIKHKESVLSILSHDLRTPLTGIIGFSDYVDSHFEKMKPKDMKEMLILINKLTKQEMAMLDYLVEWARIKYSADAFTPRKINLAKYIEKVFYTLHETASLKSIILHHEVDVNSSVFADGKMLLSILQNIVSNAIKSSNKGGKITITSDIQDEKLIIRIKDNGIGMSKEILDKLFTPHLKEYSTLKKANEGAGIGLLLVKGFLERNEGEIWVESVEGEGSSFYFSLPINKPLLKEMKADAITLG